MNQLMALSIIGLGATLSTSVLAADLPNKKSPPPAPIAAVMPYSWNGGYGEIGRAHV